MLSLPHTLLIGAAESTEQINWVVATAKSMGRQVRAASLGLALGLSLGVAVPAASASGAAENDMDNYMKVLAALQSRLDSMSTKYVVAGQQLLLLAAGTAHRWFCQRARASSVALHFQLTRALMVC